jgi:drug/metabolite transporter (DMT)-like permease
MPTLLDWVIMSGLGFVWAGGMYFVARAYSLAQASVVAPFEYTPLLFNVMWGFVIWREVPTLGTLAGALLTVLSGVYILYREQKERPSLNRSVMKESI